MEPEESVLTTRTMSPKQPSSTPPYLALPPGGSGPGVLLIHSDRADAYDPQAAELAWRRTVDFLRTYLR